MPVSVLSAGAGGGGTSRSEVSGNTMLFLGMRSGYVRLNMPGNVVPKYAPSKAW